MLYYVSLNLDNLQLVMPLTVTILFIAITLTKEKRDERKRA
jgi:hypothetical protein